MDFKKYFSETVDPLFSALNGTKGTGISLIGKKKNERLEMEYLNKYPTNDRKIVAKCSATDIQNMTVMIDQNVIVWLENKTIHIINSDYKSDFGLLSIKEEEIVSFTRYGDFYTAHEMKIGETAYKRAPYGCMIPSGQGSCSAKNKVKSSVNVHNRKETLIFVNINGNDGVLYFEPDVFDVLIRLFPKKELHYQRTFETAGGTQKSEEDKMTEHLIKLGDLKEKGLISEEAFEKLKSELIG